MDPSLCVIGIRRAIQNLVMELDYDLYKEIDRGDEDCPSWDDLVSNFLISLGKSRAELDIGLGRPVE